MTNPRLPFVNSRLYVLLAVWHLCAALALGANSKAYVAMAEAPGAITPFDTSSDALQTPYFVPGAGVLIKIDPRTHQVWEAVSNVVERVYSIVILDPITGATLATIPLTQAPYPSALIIDPTGTYAYVAASEEILQIDVATRTILRTLSIPFELIAGQLRLSGDGSLLFFPGSKGIVVVNTSSFQPVTSIPVPTFVNSLYVYKQTLLVTAGSSLGYFSIPGFQQTGSATVPSVSTIFAATAAKIYLTSNCFCGTDESMEVLDFATGQTLLSQNFSTDFANVFLSPDESRILAFSAEFLEIDPASLTVIRKAPLASIPNSAAWLNSQTVLLLNFTQGGASGAMAVIDQASAEVTAVFPLGNSPQLGEYADSRDGLIFVGSDPNADGNLDVINASSNRVSYLSNSVDFSPAGLAGIRLFGTYNGGTGFYDLPTGNFDFMQMPAAPPGYFSITAGLGAVSPDSRSYWMPFTVVEYCCDSKTLNGNADSHEPGGMAIYDTVSHSLKARISPLFGLAWPIAFSPDSSLAYVGTDKAIEVYNTATFQNIATYTYPVNFVSFAVSPDGSTIYALNGNHVHVVDAATGSDRKQFAIAPEQPVIASGMALSPDGTTLFIYANGFLSVYLMNTASGDVTTVAVPYPITNLAVIASN